MYVLENQNTPEIHRQQGDIFLPSDLRLSPYALSHVDLLDEIAHESQLAKKELAELPDSIMSARTAGNSALAHKLEPTSEQRHALAIVEDLDERAGLFSDVASTLQNEATVIVDYLQSSEIGCLQISCHQYGTWWDANGRKWFCRFDPGLATKILFNYWETPTAQAISSASFTDYVQLLKDNRDTVSD